MPQQKDNPTLGATHFLVCGLGSLGQYCVAKLKEFGVTVSAIDIAPPKIWEIAHVPDLLQKLVFGDCRQPEILTKAGIQQCQAVLLVTSDEQVNINTAFAVRIINPQVRLVVRSAKQNLNELLERRLGNFAAFDVNQLPAPAFAIAALGNEIQGLIHLDEHLLRVVKQSIAANHRWCNCRLVHELNSRSRRVLSHTTNARELPTFYQWEPNTQVKEGNTVTYIEVTEALINLSQPSVTKSSRTKTQLNFKQFWSFIRNNLSIRNTQQKLMEFWRSTEQQQGKRVALIVGITELILLVVGTVILKLNNPQIGWLSALYTASVMLLGAYDSVFSSLDPTDQTPLWLRFMNLSYMLVGTASIAVLYALLTETLLAAKFQLPSKRPPIPQQNHIILIGLDKVGRQVATFLQQLKQPLVGVSHIALESNILPQLPLIVDEVSNALTKVNLCNAKSIVVATDNEMLNLEIGLIAHTKNPDSKLILRTFDPRFSENLAKLLPNSEVLCVYSIAAEVLAAAAFGNNILNLFRLNDQTILVTEYNIQSRDTLCGLLLAEVAYGYGIIPILYRKYSENYTELMPSDDTRLKEGDRLVVVETIESLQKIKRGEMLPRCWQVQVNTDLTGNSVFEGARVISRVSGCDIKIATELMNNLPGVILTPMYKHQARAFSARTEQSSMFSTDYTLSYVRNADYSSTLKERLFYWVFALLW